MGDPNKLRILFLPFSYQEEPSSVTRESAWNWQTHSAREIILYFVVVYNPNSQSNLEFKSIGSSALTAKNGASIYILGEGSAASPYLHAFPHINAGQPKQLTRAGKHDLAQMHHKLHIRSALDRLIQMKVIFDPTFYSGDNLDIRFWSNNSAVGEEKSLAAIGAEHCRETYGLSNARFYGYEGEVSTDYERGPFGTGETLHRQILEPMLSDDGMEMRPIGRARHHRKDF